MAAARCSAVACTVEGAERVVNTSAGCWAHTGPVTVAASLGIASAILTESSLSFLGLGISVPNASWGSMLDAAQDVVLDRPMMAVYPGLLILLTVLSFNILGDVLRSALEPKIVK